jgi:sirohydrochlorin ferrochelatase
MPSNPVRSDTGILLMAHGGKKEWNDTVLAVAVETNKTMPTEVAFGMADPTTLQEAIDKLVARGVKQIVAVPLFVSSHSVVIDSTKYLLGLRPDPPKGFANLVANMSGVPDMSGHSQPASQNPGADAPPPSPTLSAPDAYTSEEPPPDPAGANARARVRANSTMDYTANSPTTLADQQAATAMLSDNEDLYGSDAAKNSSTPAADAPASSHNTPAATTISARGALPPPIQSSIPIRITPALDRSPIVAEILADRASAVSTNPARDALILVAHGPNEDSENAQWLADMHSLASQISARHHYARVDVATLRDDADASIRDAATAALRKKAEADNAAGYHVIVVPLFLSYGGIEDGLRQRLDGIEHTLSSKPLLPDPRIADWVLDSAKSQESVH